MRTALLTLAVIGIMLVPSASATSSPAFMVVYRAADSSAVLSWTPVQGASLYIVYRGPSLDKLVEIADTPNAYYLDDVGLPGNVIYGVSAWDGHYESEPVFTSFQGSAGGPGGCVSSQGQSVQVHMSSCTSV